MADGKKMSAELAKFAYAKIKGLRTELPTETNPRIYEKIVKGYAGGLVGPSYLAEEGAAKAQRAQENWN